MPVSDTDNILQFLPTRDHLTSFKADGEWQG